MREFAKDEIIKAKCPVCGCRNKVFTENVDNNRHMVGYSLKCCNCGNYNAFKIDYKENGSTPKNPITEGKEKCIQPSYCPHRDCKLYGTCNLDEPKRKPHHHHPRPDDGNKLIINVYNTPRFL